MLLRIGWPQPFDATANHPHASHVESRSFHAIISGLPVVDVSVDEHQKDVYITLLP